MRRTQKQLVIMMTIILLFTCFHGTLRVNAATDIVSSTEIQNAANTYGISASSDAYHALELINSKYADSLSSSANGTLVFMFEGVGSSSNIGLRMNAMCVVVKNHSIKYINRNSSTIPDYPFDPSLNDNTAMPTLVSGIYNFTTVNHRSSYAALNVSGAKVVRHTSQSNCYSSTSSAINIHRRSSDSIPAKSSGWVNSAGCQLVGKAGKGSNDEYANFIKAVGIVGSGATGTSKYSTSVSGKYICDRTYAYNYMSGIGYTNNALDLLGVSSSWNVDSRYSSYLPAWTYAISTGKVTLYDSNGNAVDISKRYIDGNSDLCEILEVYTNGFCKVKYPSTASSTGYNTMYAKFSDFSPSPNPTAYIATQNYPSAYRRATGSETIGSVDNNDNCLKLATSGSRTQVIYPTPSSHKIGWIEIPVTAKHFIDLNSCLDGTDYGTLGECGTADIYINGNLDGNDVSDYYKEWPEGTGFEIRDIKTNEGYSYKGMKSGSVSGTLGNGNVDIRLNYVTAGKEMPTGYDRMIPDGDYLIVSAADPSYYLDIPGTDTPAADGSNVVLTGPLTYYPEAYDIWTLQYNSGFYSICQKNSNASLDVKDGSVDISANVQVWQKNSNSCQKWAISYFDGGKGYRIQSKSSGMSLDIAGGNITNQINVQQHTGNSSDAQRWLFIPYEPQKTIKDGRYILTTAIDRHVELDVPGDTADVSDGANIRIWNDKCPSKYNSFDVKYLGNGYYNLVHSASGKYLEVVGSSTDNYGNIQLWASNSANNQKWCIIPQNDGYMLVNRNSGLVMDDEGGKTEDGTNVRQHYYNGTLAQTWFFEKAEYTVFYDANGGTNAPSEQVKYYNEDLMLQKGVPERGGYRFLGWADGNKAAAEPSYSAGENYKENRDMTLYAVWEMLEPDLILPSSLERVEEEAFQGGAFRYVILPEKVTLIEKRAFANCLNLKDIYIPEATGGIANDAFEGVSGLTIHGKSGSYAEFYAQKIGYGFIAE